MRAVLRRKTSDRHGGGFSFVRASFQVMRFCLPLLHFATHELITAYNSTIAQKMEDNLPDVGGQSLQLNKDLLIYAFTTLSVIRHFRKLAIEYLGEYRVNKRVAGTKTTRRPQWLDSLVAERQTNIFLLSVCHIEVDDGCAPDLKGIWSGPGLQRLISYLSTECESVEISNHLSRKLHDYSGDYEGFQSGDESTREENRAIFRSISYVVQEDIQAIVSQSYNSCRTHTELNDGYFAHRENVVSTGGEIGTG